MDFENVQLRDIERVHEDAGNDLAEAYGDRVDPLKSASHPDHWLADHPKYNFWDVADPGGKDYDATITALDAVKRRVLAFVAEHGLKKPAV